MTCLLLLIIKCLHMRVVSILFSNLHRNRTIIFNLEFDPRKNDIHVFLFVATIHIWMLQAQALRDSLPASDKSLSRLLGEAPFLPESALKVLEGLCHPDTADHHGKEVASGDRVTQGLGAVWSLILLRPATMIACLNIALQVRCLIGAL